MKIKEAAEYTGYTVQALYWQIREGKKLGPHFKRNQRGEWQVLKSDAKRWVK